MKATTWLCPLLTLLCATKLVYTAQRGVSFVSSYPAADGLDASMLQNDYNILAKRNKPSLSIVNPLDVLRQRLLLEIARRQMKENTRQVELNRAILKNVGKRMLGKHPYPMDSANAMQWDPLNLYHSQNQQQQQQMSPMEGRERAMHMQQPYDLELIPSTLIFDYLQQQRRPWSPYERTAGQSQQQAFDIYDMDLNDNGLVQGQVGGGYGDGETLTADDVVMGLGNSNDIKLSMQPVNGHKTVFDGQHKDTVKKPINRSGLESGTDGRNNGKANDNLVAAKHHKAFNNDYKLNDDLTTLELNEAISAMGKDSSNSNANASENIKNMDNDDYQVQRYLYHLHKNHLTRK